MRFCTCHASWKETIRRFSLEIKSHYLLKANMVLALSGAAADRVRGGWNAGERGGVADM